jgi:hypothetical protein
VEIKGLGSQNVGSRDEGVVDADQTDAVFADVDQGIAACIIDPVAHHDLTAKRGA